LKRIGLALLVVAVALAAVVFGGGLWRKPVDLAIIAGSENEALAPLIADWGRANGVKVDLRYLGSVDISRELGAGKAADFDAVWPANSLWIALGDKTKAVSDAVSILRSPVVLGLKRPVAERLGWIGRSDITVQMIGEAARKGAFRLAMTSATQSNSGASAYFAFLYALAGNPDMLTHDVLAEPKLQDDMRGLLAQVDRSSGSSGWLKDSLVANPGAYDAMINYESVIIEANQALVTAGQDPLVVIYPANGLAVADSPLGFIDKGDPAKRQAFQELQAFLLTPETQEKLLSMGRRTGLLGLSPDKADPAVWNKDWGVDVTRDIAPIPTPAPDVIAEALSLYQSELRKPSLTVWVLDVSGSMEGKPLDDLKQAMTLLLDPAASAVNLLQPSRRDVTVILPFSSQPQDPTIVQGSDSAALSGALRRVDDLQAGGGTDLYGAVGAALDVIQTYADNGTLGDYLPAIVAMTDGASDPVNRDWLAQKIAASPWAARVPIHSIAFGDADTDQLTALSNATVGRMFTAGTDIAKALRSAKGYN
jgi:Ca-activated chloride channel family protein